MAEKITSRHAEDVFNNKFGILNKTYLTFLSKYYIYISHTDFIWEMRRYERPLNCEGEHTSFQN